MNLPTVRIKKILYATDLSEEARYAYSYALSIATAYNASLILLYVMIEDIMLDRHLEGYVSREKWEEIKSRHIQDARQQLIGKKRDHVPVREALDHFTRSVGEETEQNAVVDEIIIRRGEPARQIIDVAVEKECDLIVMGRHGHGRLEEVLIGSTTKKVLRETEKPVLVVRLP